MSASRLQFGLLGTAVLLFLIALTFSNYYEHFRLHGAALQPNIVAAAGLLGFAVAGGMSLIAAALVERSKPHWPEPADKQLRQD